MDNNYEEEYDMDEKYEILSKINDYEMNNMFNELDMTERKVVIKNNSIDEINKSTDLIYNYVYIILMGVFVLIIITFLFYTLNNKNNSNSNNNNNNVLYKIFISFILLSYIFYIMYLLNIMFVKESIDKIIHFFRTGRFEINISKMEPLPRDNYLKQLCLKRKALKKKPENNDSNNNVELISASSLLSTIPENNAYYYNDNNAPKQQLYPQLSSSNQAIHFVDSNYNQRSYAFTSRL
jgi:hypothetical protein